MTAAPEDLPEAATGPAPEPVFTVLGAEPIRSGAGPALRFLLGVEAPPEVRVRSISLVAALRIVPARRRYDTAEAIRLTEVFGAPERWSTTMRALPWSRTSTVVGPFRGNTGAALPVACDADAVAAQYFHAVRDGEVPLEFRFGGTLFYLGAGGALHAARLSRAGVAGFALPAALWHAAVAGPPRRRLPRPRLHEHRARPQRAATLDELLGRPEPPR
ncbi:DUF6084 family protein [Saccharopolyspora sp. NPDC047091]|uniref:DUF6084 family protein n=1 Tax=Saccharopolyspora sp. NPDC047091 TaxID=3155924 RepID=UPI0033C4D8A3